MYYHVVAGCLLPELSYLLLPQSIREETINNTLLIAFLVAFLLLLFFIVVSLVLWRKNRELASHLVQRPNHASSAIPLFDPRKPAEVAQPPVVDTTEYLLRNRDWLGLAEECVELFDELEEMTPDLDPPHQDIARHIRLRLQEILVRAGLELIENDALFNLGRHRLVDPGQSAREGVPITSTVSPGFALGRRVLRPARVKVERIQAVHKSSEGNRENEGRA